MDISEIENRILLLKEARFFSSLHEDILRLFISHTERMTLSAGDVLFSQGEASEFIYVLIKGCLVSTLTTLSGKTTAVGKINPMETIGELGVLSGDLRSLTVQAVSVSELIKIPGNVFIELCHKNTKLMMEVSKLIIERSYKTLKLLAHERPRQNIILLMTGTPALSMQVLKEKFLASITNEIALIFVEGKSVSAITNSISEHTKHEHTILIFIEAWDTSLFNEIAEKLTHCYLVLSDESTQLTESATRMIHELKHHQHIELQLILLHPDNLSQPGYTKNWLQLADFNLHHHVRINNKLDYESVIRFMTGNAFCVVLGGGGARGLAHLGVLQAIQEKNICIDAIGGTSIGAAVGACYAISQDFLQTKHDIYCLKKATLAAMRWFNLTWPIISLYSSSPSTETLLTVTNNLRIEDLWIPYFAISSNLSTQRQVIHREGVIGDVIRMSGSLPAIFPPVVHEGQLHIDGGVLNNLPVDVMKNIMGIHQVVLACSLSKKAEYNKYYKFPPVVSLKIALLSRLGMAYRNYVYPEFFHTLLDALLLGSSSVESRNRLAAEILISPDLTRYSTFLISEKQSNDIISLGYQETMQKLDHYNLHHSLKLP